MQINKIRHGGMLLAMSLLVADPAFALDFGNVMNPTKWFGGNRDRYDDDYYYDEGPGFGGYPPPYGAPGAYGPPGFGYPGYGPPGVGAPGYGAPGVGAPGYGYPGVGAGAPGYVAPAYAAPEASSGSDALEVERLKRRIRELEDQQRQSTQSAPGQYGYQQPMSTPAPYGSAPQGYPPSPGAQQGGFAPPPGGGQQGGYAPPPAGAYGSEGYDTGQPGYGGQPGYATPPAGQSNKWYYREDPSLPPMTNQ